MQFYLCKPARGPVQLAATQAEAKAIDKGFEMIELRDDKAGRIEFINALYAQAYSVPQPGLDEINDATPKSDLMREHGEALGIETLDIAIPPPSTKALKLANLSLSTIDEIMVRTTMEEAIWKMDIAGLDKLAPVIDAHRADLVAALPVQPVAPPPRQRKLA
jgi:hypothetical protein